jgi:phage shock protein PspC (stress-responsive transcriptional regulator)
MRNITANGIHKKNGWQMVLVNYWAVLIHVEGACFNHISYYFKSTCDKKYLQ